MTDTSFSRSWWQHGALRWLALCLIALALLCAALPALLKWQIESRGSAALGRALHVESVGVNLWTLELTLSGLQMDKADGQGIQFSVERLRADVAWRSVLQGAPILQALHIQSPRLLLTHWSDGRYDIDDVLQRLLAEPAQPQAQPFLFALYNLTLDSGELDFIDNLQSGDVRHQVRKLQLSLPYLTNVEASRNVVVQPHLAFELNGSTFDSAASGAPFAHTRKGQAALKISKLDLAPYLAYMPQSLPIRIKSGVLDTELALDFADTTTDVTPHVAITGRVKLGNLRMTDNHNAALFSAASLVAEIADLRPLEKKAGLKSLEITAPVLNAARQPSGRMAWSGVAGVDTNTVATVVAGNSGSQPRPLAGGIASLPENASDSATAKAPVAKQAQSKGGWQISLEAFSLHDGQVQWQDDAVSPQAQMALSKVRLKATGLRWPVADQPAQFDGELTLHTHTGSLSKSASGLAGLAAISSDLTPPFSSRSATESADSSSYPTVSTATQLAFQGEISPSGGKLSTSLKGVNLADFGPYIAQLVEPDFRGLLQANIEAQWAGGAVALTVPQASLRDAALHPRPRLQGVPATPEDLKAAAREVNALGLLEVNGLHVQWPQRTVQVDKVRLRQPDLRLRHESDGHWNFAQWLKPRSDTPAAASPETTPPWSVHFSNVELADASVSVVDRVPAKPVRVVVSSFNANVNNLWLDGKQPATVALSGRVRTSRTEAGTLAFNGLLMWNPMLLQGRFDAADVPVQALLPYLQLDTQVEVQRAEAGFNGQVRYADLPAGALVQVGGDAALSNVRVSTVPRLDANGKALGPAEELMNWKDLTLNGLDFSLAPGGVPQFAVREVALADAFARMVITPQGHLQLLELLQPAKPDEPKGAVEKSGNKPEFDIGPIRVKNGRVAFADKFIQPNYSAALTDLEGSLSRFSSQSSKVPATGAETAAMPMADLELRGRAEGSASLEIIGQVNPLAQPLALDIKGLVRDLELSPLSSYAIKYAGYGIERGRLNMDVNYVITPDGDLRATNKLLLRQLTFGEKVEGAGNTLPVKLAVALLTDRNGVIDLEVPISGSLNDPQFSVWPVVWKFVGQVIAKAVLSPFSLLSGALGSNSAEDLARVPFELGTSRLTEAAMVGLDKVAQLLLEKPALDLLVTGAASLEQERAAMLREQLQAKLRAEKGLMTSNNTAKGLTSTAAVAIVPSSSGTAATIAPSTVAVAEDYAAQVQQLFRKSDLRRPRNVAGQNVELTAQEMEAMLLDTLTVDDEAVRELANARALAVRDALKGRNVPVPRVFLGSPKTTGLPPDWLPSANLSLTGR